LGGIYGRAGKIPEAMDAYKKSAELDPTNAAQAYRRRRHHPLQRGKNEGSRRAVKESNRTGSQERAKPGICSVPR